MVSNTPLQVVQLSDTHLFADQEGVMLGCPTNKTFTAVLDAVRSLPMPPDLLLLTGDLSQDETPASYEQLTASLRPHTVPAYWLPGNHDVPELMAQVLCNSPVSTDKSFQAGNWHFILLSTQAPRQVDGHLTVDSLAWLETQLQEHPDSPTLIALHHPPCLIGSAWMDAIGLQNSQAFYDVVDRYSQVKLVIFGHIHQAFSEVRRGVTYLGCPSTCVQFKPQMEKMVLDRQGPGFRLLSLYPDGQFTTQVERVQLSDSLATAQ
ncbi:MAG TPA: 3',5'-cyclic-AMP phosphodiesterase [Leptolyngbyaceae cyanobacterium]